MSPEKLNDLVPCDKSDYEDEVERMQELAMNNARQQSIKIYRKNKRELDRLQKLAQDAVLENNYLSYKYAIEKSRTILRQPFTEEIIRVGWQTTRKQIWEIVNAHSS